MQELQNDKKIKVLKQFQVGGEYYEKNEIFDATMVRDYIEPVATEQKGVWKPGSANIFWEPVNDPKNRTHEFSIADLDALWEFI